MENVMIKKPVAPSTVDAATTDEFASAPAKTTPKPRAKRPTRVAVAKPAPVAVEVTSEVHATEKPPKLKKTHLVRDSFTMPEAEYAMLALLKKRCLAVGVAAKKSELLRAAVAGLVALDDQALVAALQRLDAIKTGRPAKALK